MRGKDKDSNEKSSNGADEDGSCGDIFGFFGRWMLIGSERVDDFFDSGIG